MPPKTSAFEDLILGSQFLPLLAKLEASDQDTTKTVGVLQCRRCGATFLQELEALAHYKLHVFESHKEYFHVVVGSDVCPAANCTVNKNVKSSNSLHFHCSYCNFTGTDILELPLHMEKSHLAFYKEVSLVLRGGDSQLSKVYECGECGNKIQGTVSVIQHLLVHDCQKVLPPLVNGRHTAGNETRINNKDLLSNNKIKTKDIKVESTVEAQPVNGAKTRVNGESVAESEDESLEEVNPLDLLTTVIEADSGQGTNASCNQVPPTVTTTTSSSNEVPMGGLVITSSNEYFLVSLPAPTHFLDASDSSTQGPPDPQTEQACEENISSSQPAPLPAPQTSDDNHVDTPDFGGLIDPPGVFQCDICDKAFKYQYILVSHKKNVHEGVAPGKYKCGVCPMELTTRYELKRHLLNAHSTSETCNGGGEVNNCVYCGVEFPDQMSLKVHTATHTKSSSQGIACLQERGVKCESCGVEFSSKSDLTHHVVKYQGTCNPDKSAEGVRCATCGEELDSLESLKEHRRASHPPNDGSSGGGRRGFQCDYCGKTFNCRSNLRDHLVVHTGEKPYPCDICGKTFSFIHNMKTHRLTHNEGRNETCPYCDKAYKSKISLYYHMKKGNCRGLSTKQVPEGFERCSDCLQMYSSGEKFQAHKDRGLCHMSYRCQHCGIRCSSEEKLERHLQKQMCLKNPDEAPRKKHKKHKNSDKAETQPDLVCERCNYTKDCCCTFSCPMCNKRIFSVIAFTIHRSRTCPALKLRKEKLRNVIHGKKHSDRREDFEDNISIKKTSRHGRKIESKSNRDTLTKSSKYKIKEVKISPKLSLKKDNPSRNGVIKIKKLAQPGVVISEEDSNTTTSVVINSCDNDNDNDSDNDNIKVKLATEDVNDNINNDIDEDSNSGSLTDLSTFTSPNILQSVADTAD